MKRTTFFSSSSIASRTFGLLLILMGLCLVPGALTVQSDDSVERVTVLDFTAEGGVSQS